MYKIKSIDRIMRAKKVEPKIICVLENFLNNTSYSKLFFFFVLVVLILYTKSDGPNFSDNFDK